jgi:hypothetical protein
LPFEASSEYEPGCSAIVDLKGFALTGAAGDSVVVGIGSFAGTLNIPNTSPYHCAQREIKEPS